MAQLHLEKINKRKAAEREAKAQQQNSLQPSATEGQNVGDAMQVDESSPSTNPDAVSGSPVNPPSTGTRSPATEQLAAIVHGDSPQQNSISTASNAGPISDDAPQDSEPRNSSTSVPGTTLQAHSADKPMAQDAAENPVQVSSPVALPAAPPAMSNPDVQVPVPTTSVPAPPAMSAPPSNPDVHVPVLTTNVATPAPDSNVQSNSQSGGSVSSLAKRARPKELNDDGSPTNMKPWMEEIWGKLVGASASEDWKEMMMLWGEFELGLGLPDAGRVSVIYSAKTIAHAYHYFFRVKPISWVLRGAQARSQPGWRIIANQQAWNKRLGIPERVRSPSSVGR